HNGYLEERPVSDQATYLTHQWFLELLRYYLQVHPIAQTTGLGMGFRMALPDEINIRRPDTGVVFNDNPVPLLLYDNCYNGIFDMCIEAVSDSTDKTIERDTVTKKEEYAKGGVREYYILDGNKEHTCFYRLSARGGFYIPVKTTKNGLVKSKVLPGFQFRVTDLYDRPSQRDMIEDDVYKGFVSRDYSEAKQQAREERKARQKESKARQKAEAQAR
ncbi:MAG: Uma2 family endonuclease, partial [Gammaproteobacteria bacterium]|nr:Uma2 family endonuclease [Gammaproteobacteria bacterium]